jgi:hypothetical protein
VAIISAPECTPTGRARDDTHKGRALDNTSIRKARREASAAHHHTMVETGVEDKA